MGQAVYPAGANRITGETLALSSTLASLGAPPHAYQVILYNPAVDFRLNLNPLVVAVVYYDASSAAGSRFELASGSSSATNGTLVDDLTDRDTATGTGTAMDAGTTSDFLYVCTKDIIGGLRAVIGAVNGNAATLTVKYRKSDDTWADISATDGTASGGATLAVTGSITWTVPTDWKRTTLRAAVSEADSPAIEGYWLQLSWSAALDSDTEIDELWTLNKATDRGYFRAGQEYELSLDRRNVGAIEAVLAAGTDTLEITWIRAAGV